MEDVGWGLPEYHPILPKLLGKFLNEVMVDPSHFSVLVFPPFLSLFLPTDCDKFTLPQVGISKIRLPLENLVQDLCLTL